MSSGKKTGIIIGVLVLLGAVGFGVTRYIESSAVTMMRSLVDEYSKVYKLEVGEISYSLLSNKAELKNIKAQFHTTDADYTFNADAIEIENPNRSLGDFLSDKTLSDSKAANTMVDVADSLTLRNYTVDANGFAQAKDTKVKMTCAIEQVTKIRITPSALASVKSGKGTFNERYIDFLYGVEYGQTLTDKAVVTADGGPMFKIKVIVGKTTTTGYANFTLKDISSQNIQMLMNEKEVGSIGLMRMANMNFPPKEAMLKFMLLSENAAPDEEQVIEQVRTIFVGEKPFLGLFEIADCKIDSEVGMDFSLGRFVYENSTTHPFTFGLKLERLQVPVTMLTPRLSQLALLGYKQLDITGSLTMTLPDKTDDVKAAMTLQVADMGKADLTFEGIAPGGLLNVADSEDDLLMTLLNIGYTDSGLLPRVTAAGKRLSGAEPDAALAMFEAAMRAQLVTPATTDKAGAEKLLQQLMEFARKPGSLRAVLKPEKPLSVEALAKIPDTSPAFTLKIEPGAKSLQEATEEILKGDAAKNDK